jgi:hypothetical protein
MDERSLQEDFKTALNIWQFQINSFWSRNSFFAAFHSAIMAAVWQISKNASMMAPGRRLAATGFCYAGIFLSLVWLVNNVRVHQYIVYWWTRASSIEKLLNREENARLVQGYEGRRPGKLVPGQYHVWMNLSPVLFIGVWVVIRIACF